MTRRIICYVVFVILIWSAHTQEEEKVRDMFKSNMTRNDFSNLLQSLIKLNEQRVSVLQRLYRLEDYGVLSEVLRSGDKNTGNGNPNNLFLIVMSKNENDPSRRKIGFQVVDSATSLNAGSSNSNPKLQFVLDPAGYFTQYIRKENRLESLFGNFPRVGPTNIQRTDDGSKKLNTTKETLKFDKPGLRTEIKHDSKILKTATGRKANESRKHPKINSRYEIVSNKGIRPHSREKLLNNDGNNSKYPQTVGYNSQSHEYFDIDFTIKNNKLTTKPIIIKHTIRDNHQNSKYPIKSKVEKDDDFYGSPYSNVDIDHNRQYTKITSGFSIEKHYGNNHNNPKTKKYTPKAKVLSNQKKDKLTTIPIIIKDIIFGNHKNSKYPLEDKDEPDEDDYGSPFSDIENYFYSQNTNINSDIPIKTIHIKKHNNPKMDKKIPKVNVQNNRHPKLNLNKPKLNHQGNKYFKIKTTIKITTPKNYYTINGTASENNQVKNPSLNNDNTNANSHDLTNNNIENKFLLLASENVFGNKLVNSDREYGNYPGFKHLKDVRDNSKKDDTKTAKDTPFGNYPGFENFEDVTDNSNKNKPNTAKDKPNGNYLGFKHLKSLRDNSNKEKTKTAKDTPFGNYPGFENLKDVRDNSNKDKMETAKDTPFGNYPGFENLKDVRDNSNQDKLKTANDTPYGNYPGFENFEDRDNSNTDKPKTANDTPFGVYPGFENLKDVRDNSNKDKPKTAKDTPLGNNPSFEHHKDVTDNFNKNKPNTTIGTPSGNFHGFEHHKNVMENLNKYKPNTAYEKHYRNNLNVEAKKDPVYYGVKMFDNGKKSAEEFSIFITNVGNGTAEQVKQRNEPKLDPYAFDQLESKPVARKPFTKCLIKKALKLCSKSCISAYKNVCRRLKCTSRSKKALKSECQRSCKKTFSSPSSKYSNEGSEEEDSDESYSDDDDDYS